MRNTIAFATISAAILLVTIALRSYANDWRHNTVVVDTALANDGKSIFTVDVRGDVAQWKLATGDCLTHFATDLINVNDISLAPGDKYVAVFGTEVRKSVTIVVDAASGKRLFTTEQPIYWVSSESFVAISGFGTGSSNATLWDWRGKDFEPTRKLDLGPAAIHGITHAGSNRIVLACAKKDVDGALKNSLVLYDVNAGRMVSEAATSVPVSQIENSLAVATNPFRVFLSGNCRNAEIFEGEALKRIRSIEVPASHDGFQRGSISPDGKLGALGKDQIHVFDVPAGKLNPLDWKSKDLKLPEPAPNQIIANAFARYFQSICSLHFLPDGHSLVGVTFSGDIILFDAATRKTERKFHVVAWPQ